MKLSKFNLLIKLETDEDDIVFNTLTGNCVRIISWGGNRELLGLRKLAGEFDTIFDIDDLVLELNHENKDEKILVFDYRVTLASEKLLEE